MKILIHLKIQGRLLVSLDDRLLGEILNVSLESLEVLLVPFTIQQYLPRYIALRKRLVILQWRFFFELGRCEIYEGFWAIQVVLLLVGYHVLVVVLLVVLQQQVVDVENEEQLGYESFSLHQIFR